MHRLFVCGVVGHWWPSKMGIFILVCGLARFRQARFSGQQGIFILKSKVGARMCDPSKYLMRLFEALGRV